MRTSCSFPEKKSVMGRCSQKVDYERKSGPGKGHKIPMPRLHHREVAPEEVLELHKLLQTWLVLCNSLPQLCPALQQDLDLCPKYVHSLWAQLPQLDSLVLHLFYLLPDGFIINLWGITYKIYHPVPPSVSLRQSVQIVPLYDNEFIPKALCILFSERPIWSTYELPHYSQLLMRQ